jgi:hypothetical protein
MLGIVPVERTRGCLPRVAVKHERDSFVISLRAAIKHTLDHSVAKLFINEGMKTFMTLLPTMQ